MIEWRRKDLAASSGGIRAYHAPHSVADRVCIAGDEGLSRMSCRL